MLQIKQRKSLEALLQAKKAMSKDEMRMYVGGGFLRRNKFIENRRFYDGDGGDGSYASPYKMGDFEVTGHIMDEVVVIGHQTKSTSNNTQSDNFKDSPSYLGPAHNSFNDNGMNKHGIASSSSSQMPNIQTNDSHPHALPIHAILDDGGDGKNPLANAVSINRSDLIKMEEAISDNSISKLIEGLWDKGLLYANPDSVKYNFTAFYDAKTGKFYFTQATTVTLHTIVHEYVHYLQDQNHALSKGMKVNENGEKVPNVSGDLNNEMQADILGTIYSYARNQDLYTNRWMSKESKGDLEQSVEVDSMGNVTVKKNLWDKLNDNSYMLKLQNEWRTYHTEHPSSSETNLAGEKTNWNYDWKDYFDKLGIKHP